MCINVLSGDNANFRSTTPFSEIKMHVRLHKLNCYQKKKMAVLFNYMPIRMWHPSSVHNVIDLEVLCPRIE